MPRKIDVGKSSIEVQKLNKKRIKSLLFLISFNSQNTHFSTVRKNLAVAQSPAKLMLLPKGVRLSEKLQLTAALCNEI